MRYSHKLFIILCLSGTAFSSPALAQDVPKAVQLLLNNIERQAKVKPTYESIEVESDGSVTIKRLAVNKPATGSNASINMRIDEVVLSNISDAGGGLYEIGGATFTNIIGDVSSESSSFTFDLPETVAEGWFLQDAGENPTPLAALRADMTTARKMSTGKIKIAANGQSYAVDSYEMTWDGDPRTGAGTSSFKVRNISIPAQAIAIVDPSGMLKQLGYDALSLDVENDSKLDISEGIAGVSGVIRLSGRDIGMLTIAGTSAGIPLSVYAEMAAVQKSGQAVDFNALFPKVQDVSLSDISLRFDDASLTGRLLPMIAAMQGMDEAALIGNAGAMAQMGLMQLQNQAFTEQAVAAINNYLKAPKSLTIKANPASPLKISDIMAMNPSAPGEIIARLGLSVSSND